MTAQNSTTSEQGFILFYCKYCLVNINSDLFKTCKAILNPQYGQRSPWLTLSVLPIPKTNSRRKYKDPPKVVFHQRSSSTKGCLPLKVIFHQRLFSTEGCLPPKDVLHQKSSSNEGHLPPKVVFHQRWSSTKGCLPLKVIFH